MSIIINGITNPVIAASTGDAEGLRELIAAGVDINQRQGNVTPVVAAIREDSRECAKILIEAGADIETPRYGGMNMAELAVVYARTEILVMLIQAGAPAPSETFIIQALADYDDGQDCIACIMHLIENSVWERKFVHDAARRTGTDTARRVIAMIEAEGLGQISATIAAAAPAAGDVAI